MIREFDFNTIRYKSRVIWTILNICFIAFIVGLFGWINLSVFSIGTDLGETIGFIILDLIILSLVLFLIGKIFLEWKTSKKFIFTNEDITINFSTRTNIKLDSIDKIQLGTKYEITQPTFYTIATILFILNPKSGALPPSAVPKKTIEFILKDGSSVYENYYGDRDFIDFIVQYCSNHNIELITEKGVLDKPNGFMYWTKHPLTIIKACAGWKDKEVPGYAFLVVWLECSLLFLFPLLSLFGWSFMTSGISNFGSWGELFAVVLSSISLTSFFGIILVLLMLLFANIVYRLRSNRIIGAVVLILIVLLYIISLIIRIINHLP